MRPAPSVPSSLSLSPGRAAIFGARPVTIDLYLTRLFCSFASAAGDPPASVHIRCWTSHFPSVSLGLLRSSFFFYPRSLLVSSSVRRKKVGFCSRRCCPVSSRPVLSRSHRVMVPVSIPVPVLSLSSLPPSSSYRVVVVSLQYHVMCTPSLFSPLSSLFLRGAAPRRAVGLASASKRTRGWASARHGTVEYI